MEYNGYLVRENFLKNHSSANSSAYNDWVEKAHKKHLDTITELCEKFIFPEHGRNLTMTQEIGLFTSTEYGSYRINFYKGGLLCCWIIADSISGKYEVFAPSNKFMNDVINNDCN